MAVAGHCFIINVCKICGIFHKNTFFVVYPKITIGSKQGRPPRESEKGPYAVVDERARIGVNIQFAPVLATFLDPCIHKMQTFNLRLFWLLFWTLVST